MKNAPDLDVFWPEIHARGAAALKPHLARRVLARVVAARDELNTQTAILLGLGTAVACLVLTLALTLWSERRATDAALDQWSALASENASFDQDSL